jgi:O-antigen/teichoic acid export membrane protein
MIIGYIVIVHFGYNAIHFNHEYVLLVISGILFSFFLIYQQYFIAAKRILPFTISTFGARAIVLIFNLASIFFFRADPQHFIYSFFIGTLVIFFALLLFVDISKALAPKSEQTRAILSFSLPLTINSLISISFTNGYRVLISALIPFGSLAIFGLISQIAMAYYIGLTSLILPFNSSAYQYLEEQKGQVNRVPSYRKRCLILGITGIVCTLGISFFLLKFFKGGIYFEGFQMLPILLAAQFLFLLYSHEYIVLSYFNKTSKITLATLIGVLLILMTFYPLISSIGVWGVCIASLLGYSGQYFSAFFFSKKLTKA